MLLLLLVLVLVLVSVVVVWENLLSEGLLESDIGRRGRRRPFD